MPEATTHDTSASWTECLRQAPTGILLIAAFLTILGVGSMLGGVYMLIGEGEVSYWGAGTGLVAGPALLYLAYHLVRSTHWTWLTLVLLLVLLFASSLLRLALAPGIGVAPLAELAIEAGAAYYLTRRRIRVRFGWSRD